MRSNPSLRPMAMTALLGIVLLSISGCSGQGSARPERRHGANSPPSRLTVGKPLPDVMLAKPGGGTASLLESAHGQVLLVDVWATWCGPCKFVAPHIQALHNRFKERGFTAIGVMTDDNASEIGDRVLAEEKPVYPQLFDDARRHLDEAWGEPSGIPILVLVDRDGTVLRVDTGAGDIGGLQRAVEAAVRGQKLPESGGQTQ